ncbi:MAG: dTDP-4-dehydrorhamnose 3,5-epimerase [Idiomarina sp.]|nr:dTDP-4-dehydrorhamnose 3,5-epimerase [Idiomarina sp.]
MKITETQLKDVLILEPRVFEDERGFFMESYNQQAFNQAVGRNVEFVQDNHSKSAYGVLRGLHYQIQQAQGKLVRVLQGEIFDVAVDVRESSPTFGDWVGVTLSADNKRQLWVPEGFAHGFLVLSDSAEILYKATNFYAPEHERSIRWDDPSIAIDWPTLQRGQLLNPVKAAPTLSVKDAKAVNFADADYFL